MAEVLAVRPVGPPVIVVSGAVASTVKERAAGVGSIAPAASTARTSNVFAPSVWAAVVWGEVQATNPAEAPTRHWKVEPGSVDVNVNVGVASLVSPVGPPVIVVFGGPASLTTNVRVVTGGLGNSVLTARTEKVYGPSGRSVYGCALDL